MIKIVNLRVLKEVIGALIDCGYNITVRVIPDDLLLYEVDIERSDI